MTVPPDESKRRHEELLARDKHLLRELQQLSEKIKTPDLNRLTVNKRTHRIRFENESEDEVTIVIEPRDVPT